MLGTCRSWQPTRGAGFLAVGCVIVGSRRAVGGHIGSCHEARIAEAGQAERRHASQQGGCARVSASRAHDLGFRDTIWIARVVGIGVHSEDTLS